MPRFIPERDRCAAECGARRVPGDTLCGSCRKRNAGRSGPSSPMELPKRTYIEPIRVETSEEEQYRELEELSRCPSCGTSWGGHTLDCTEYLQFIDLTSEYDPGDYAESL
jgi:hypothetical protein